MKIWVLNLVGISLMGILIEILLPSGKTNKYIKGILSLVTISVVISPIISIFTNHSAIKNFFDQDIVVDEQFVASTHQSSNQREEKLIESMLESQGYKGVEINIIPSSDSQNKIEFVKICTKNMVIDSENSNIDIKGKITSLVSKRLKIDVGKIYYE
ncbi:MAG: stage III sporulation protein AF [Clostridia bacterium]|mgnify:CR=1 FL=1|nr:stage III sporulation protein AF [Clostridia bacterium]MDY5264760.1 stage III sporulation protein AF [Eubacteriales bacterium]